MALNEITDADIRKYILGQSLAEQTDRLDELSFADEYSERIGAVEREIIDDYVSGGLGPAERSSFESHYLSSPLRRERVEFAKAFANFADRTHPVLEPTPAKWSIFDLFRQRAFALQFGAVAMLLILGSIAWLVFRVKPANIALNDLSTVAVPETGPADVQGPAPVPSPSQAIDVTETSPSNVTEAPKHQKETSTPPPRPKVQRSRLATIMLTPALRSASFQQVEIPAGATSVEFQLRLETDDSGPLSAEVVDLLQRGSVWSAKNVSARKGRAGSTASVRVPSRVLSKGEYQVSLSKITKGGKSEKIGDYFFRVAP